MRKLTIFISFQILFIFNLAIAQNGHFKVEFEISIAEEVRPEFIKDGRLFIFLSQNHNSEPRFQTWPNPINKNFIFAKNFSNVSPDDQFLVNNIEGWIQVPLWDFYQVPEGVYSVQVLWDQDTKESRIDAPGNLYSKVQKLTIDKDNKLTFILDQIASEREVADHQLARYIEIQSDSLSRWWGKPIPLKAAVLLPSNYDSSKAYPIRYNVAGYGGRYTRINGLLRNPEFMNWWESEDAPQIINVFLDGEGPFGDSYQMDSDNSGPYGYTLIHELIPHIETTFRGTSDATTRFVDGCSTGGWVSLGLQLYYPDFFGGTFSYSPDAIEFENYQLINIYKDENAYVNEVGYLRPVMRDISGEPLIPLKEFIQYENVLGSSNTYVNSGGQFSAHNALYSPKGENGLPKPIFDPVTGIIDKEVAEYWKKYDFKIYAKENWESLGPKLQDKIYIWMGDMDQFYLNPATRAFSAFLENTENPHSNAVIEFSPMQGHCAQYSHKEVLLKIKEKLVTANH